MKYTVTFDDYSFFGNLYLSIVFSLYKVNDYRKSSKDITLIENSNIKIKHNLFGKGQIEIYDKD